VIVGPGAAFIFLLYAVQFTWSLLSGALCLASDRGNLRSLEEAEGIVATERV
jgi:hypothetical protein